MDSINHKYIEFPFADYLLVFISIIIGYVVTEFFAGWGGMIRNQDKIKIYWLHLAWTFNFFFQLMENWWWMWGNRIKITEHVTYFFFTLASPLIFYLISVTLFPTIESNSDEKFDYKTFYHSKSHKTFFLFGLLMVSYIVNNLWLREYSLFSVDNIFSISGFLASLVLYYFRQPRVHQVFIFTGSIILIIYIGFNSVQ